MGPRETVMLAHGRISLALHLLRAGEGPLLLLLHGLGERTPPSAPPEAAPWAGPVWGLDFTGHGRSTVPRSGGYTCELLMADADIALAHLGDATVYGRGLGGYVGVLLAGARPAAVRGVIVADGPGLEGGGSHPRGWTAPRFEPAEEPPAGSGTPPDPHALHELGEDARPPDYVLGYARAAVEASGLKTPIVVSATARPRWLAALLEEPAVEALPAQEALAQFTDAADAGVQPASGGAG